MHGTKPAEETNPPMSVLTLPGFTGSESSEQFVHPAIDPRVIPAAKAITLTTFHHIQGSSVGAQPKLLSSMFCVLRTKVRKTGARSRQRNLNEERLVLPTPQLRGVETMQIMEDLEMPGIRRVRGRLTVR